MRQTLVATALLTAVLFVPSTSSAEPGPPSPASVANFEGEHIDLRQGWGEATACASDGTDTECFRTERELDRYLLGRNNGPGQRSLDSASAEVTIQASCSASVRLYSNTFYSGSVLVLTVRGAVLNLATWSFSNVTSSYQIGPCAATFYDGANANPPIYPGGTLAGSGAAVMVAGWDNRISSVYIS
jgi:hypothetical protein